MTTDLKRAFFGYSASSVRSVLLDREAMVARMAEETRVTEQRAQALSSELADARGHLDEQQSQLEATQDLADGLAKDLEQCVGQREATQRELLALRQRLDEVSRERLDLEQEVSAARIERLRLQQESRAQAQRVEELEELLATYRAELEERSLAAARQAEPSEPAEPTQTPGPGPSTTEELTSVLQLAEQAVVRIMESTKVRATEELHDIDAERDRIRREIETMTAWRDRAAPMIASLEATMDEVQVHAGEIGVRIGEVLGPVTVAVSQLSSELASLDALPPATRATGTTSEPSDRGRIIELRDEQAPSPDATHNP